MPVDARIATFLVNNGVTSLGHVESLSVLPAFRDIVVASHDRYADLIKNRGKLGVPTGLAEFDRDTGGLKDGQMTVIAGDTNVGKSTVALNFVNTALQQGMGVALFTLEMDREEIADLLVSMNAEVDRNVFNTGNFGSVDLEAIACASLVMAKFPLFIDDAPTLTAKQIRGRVMQLKHEEHIRLVMVDYAQLVAPEDAREPREQQVAHIARELRSLAKEVRLPFLVLSQLNDEGKLRESRVLAHEAHNVCRIEETDSGGLQMRVYKGRRIPKKTYALDWQPLFCKVLPMAKEGTETNPDWMDK